MGQLLSFPKRNNWEPWLTKKQIAATFNFTTRWVEIQAKHGMPSRLISGRRRYLLSECEKWLEEQEREKQPERVEVDEPEPQEPAEEPPLTPDAA